MHSVNGAARTKTARKHAAQLWTNSKKQDANGEIGLNLKRSTFNSKSHTQEGFCYSPTSNTLLCKINFKKDNYTMMLKIMTIPVEYENPNCRVELNFVKWLSDTLLETGVSPNVVAFGGFVTFDQPFYDRVFATSLLKEAKTKMSARQKKEDEKKAQQEEEEKEGKNPETKYICIVVECFDMSLFDFLRNPNMPWSNYTVGGILLQVLLVRRKLKQVVPSVSQNDFHIGNILLKEHDKPQQHQQQAQFIEFVFNGVSFYVRLDLCPWLPALWDWYYAHVDAAEITAVRAHHLVASKPTMYASLPRQHSNEYVDLHKMFDTISGTLEGVVVSSKGKKKTKTKKKPKNHCETFEALMNFVVPEDLKCEKYGHHANPSKHLEAWNTKLRTVEQVLTHPFFDVFRIKPSKEDAVLFERYDLH